MSSQNGFDSTIARLTPASDAINDLAERETSKPCLILGPTDSEKDLNQPSNRNNCESPGGQDETTQQILTLVEAALLVRCSKAHLLNVIHGRVGNVPPLPHIRMGRRILIRRGSLDRWLLAVESAGSMV